MCGIFGFLLNKSLSDNDISKGIIATKKLQHRGPDNTNYWFDTNDGIFLGHTRLKIIDTTNNSNQPFSKKNSHLIFNGEIYNHCQLRENLASKGLSFHTNGDTEVLFELLHNYNTAKINDIDGMFAFAFYKNQTLTLAVDYFGEKPLYWHKSNIGFFFSSEVKPLVEMLGLCATQDNEITSSFLSLGYTPNSSTIFNGLKKIEPATILKIDNKLSIKINKYWRIPQQSYETGRVAHIKDSQLDDILNIILKSLALRASADVPVGLFLSSGLDSTLIAALLKKELKNDNILALTASYGHGTSLDESHDAAKIAKYLKMNHIIVDSRIDQSNYNLGRLNDIFGEPNSGITAFSVQQMSILAKKYFTVAITGMGADEIFLGYGKYRFLYKNRNILKNTLISNAASFMIKNNIPIKGKLGTLASLLSVEHEDLLPALKGMPFFSDKNIYKKYKNMGPLWYKNEGINNDMVLQQRKFDIETHLPGYIIPIIERPSMSASLETRTPFLSKNLIEYISQIDYRILFRDGQKDVLKKLVQRYLPKDLIDRPKKGFSVPTNTFIQNTFHSKYISNNKDEIMYGMDKMHNDARWGRYVTRLIISDYYRNK